LRAKSPVAGSTNIYSSSMPTVKLGVCMTVTVESVTVRVDGDGEVGGDGGGDARVQRARSCGIIRAW